MTARWLAGLVACLLAWPAGAGPWVEPGDARLRADIELLRSNGIITGPTESWPLPWAQIERGLERARGLALPPGLAAAVQRVEAMADYNRRANRFRAEGRVTNEPALVRGFQQTARGDVDMTVAAEHDLSRFTVGWGASYIKRGDRPATEVTGGPQLRPIFVAMQLGNWALYGGHVETYWGPGNDGGLLFSTSARPIPKVGVKLLEPRRIDFPVLKWLGPLRFDMFGGVANEERNDFSNPVLLGMRVEFEPTPGFTAGFVRGIQMCGRNRPCDFQIWVDALIGLFDRDNTGTFDEPGNQLAGFDFSYHFRLGRAGHGGKLFVETVAEDEDNFVIEQFARRVGGRLHGPLGDGGDTYAIGIEYTDALASNLFGGTKYPGSLYNNFIYTDGFTYDRRPLGFSLDGDSRLITIDAMVTDARNRRFHGSIRRANINLFDNPNHRISQTNERMWIGTGGADLPTRFGDIRLELRAQTDRPDTPGVKDGEVQVEFGWRSQF
ncbi:MAG: capsule assembly Wzi family protein [Sphingomonadaceae bacterium]